MALDGEKPAIRIQDDVGDHSDSEYIEGPLRAVVTLSWGLTIIVENDTSINTLIQLTRNSNFKSNFISLKDVDERVHNINIGFIGDVEFLQSIKS